MAVPRTETIVQKILSHLFTLDLSNDIRAYRPQLKNMKKAWEIVRTSAETEQSKEAAKTFVKSAVVLCTKAIHPDHSTGRIASIRVQRTVAKIIASLKVLLNLIRDQDSFDAGKARIYLLSKSDQIEAFLSKIGMSPQVASQSIVPTSSGSGQTLDTPMSERQKRSRISGGDDTRSRAVRVVASSSTSTEMVLLDGVRQDLNAARTELVEVQNALQAEIQGLQNLMEHNENQSKQIIENMQQETEELKQAATAKIQEEQSKIVSLESALKNALETSATTQGQVSALQAQLEEAARQSGEIDTLQSALKNALETSATTQGQVSALQAQLEEARRQSGEIDTLQSALREASETSATTQGQVRDLRAKLEEAKRTIAAYKAEYDRWNIIQQEMIVELNELREQRDEMAHRISVGEQELSTLRDELDSLRAKANEQETRGAAAVEEEKKKVRTLEGAIKRTLRINREAAKREKDLKQEIDDKMRRIAEKTRETVEKDAEIRALEEGHSATLQQAEAQLVKLTEEREQLRTKLEGLETQNVQLQNYLNNGQALYQEVLSKNEQLKNIMGQLEGRVVFLQNQVDELERSRQAVYEGVVNHSMEADRRADEIVSTNRQQQGLSNSRRNTERFAAEMAAIQSERASYRKRAMEEERRILKEKSRVDAELAKARLALKKREEEAMLLMVRAREEAKRAKTELRRTSVWKRVSEERRGRRSSSSSSSGGSTSVVAVVGGGLAMMASFAAGFSGLFRM